MRKFMREGGLLLTQVTKEHARMWTEGLMGCKCCVRISLLQVQMLQRFTHDLKRWQSSRRTERHHAQRVILSRRLIARTVQLASTEGINMADVVDRMSVHWCLLSKSLLANVEALRATETGARAARAAFAAADAASDFIALASSPSATIASALSSQGASEAVTAAMGAVELLVSSPAESLSAVFVASASPDAADGSPGPQPLSPRDDSPMAISRDPIKCETLSASPESDDLQLASMLHGWQQQLEDKGDVVAHFKLWRRLAQFPLKEDEEDSDSDFSGADIDDDGANVFFDSTPVPLHAAASAKITQRASVLTMGELATEQAKAAPFTMGAMYYGTTPTVNGEIGPQLEQRRTARKARRRKWAQRKQAEERKVKEDAAFEVQLIARMRKSENHPPPLQLARLRDWHKYHVASQLHELWRAPRRRPVGSIPAYDPRPKVISGHTFDIANLDFDSLPERYQRENVETAEYICDAVHAEVISTGSALFDEAMIEARSSELHDFWIARNKGWCDPALTVPFHALSKEEQEKDRAIVRAATEAFVKCPRFGPGLAPLPGSAGGVKDNPP